MRTIPVLGLAAAVAIVCGALPAYAEPLEDLTASASNYTGHSGTVTVLWNHDDAASYYHVGCVSCTPNLPESTTENAVKLHGVTPFPNSDSAMLYVIAYDQAGEIIAAKQLIIDLQSS